MGCAVLSRSSEPAPACGRPTIRTRQHLPQLAHAIEEALGALSEADRRQDHGDQLRHAVRLRACLLKTAGAIPAASTMYSLPMAATKRMVAFYRSLGLQVAEPSPRRVRLCGPTDDQPSPIQIWQKSGFTLRAPARRRPAATSASCGADPLIRSAGCSTRWAPTVIEGPVPREGVVGPPRRAWYVRDPDGTFWSS